MTSSGLSDREAGQLRKELSAAVPAPPLVIDRASRAIGMARKRRSRTTAALVGTGTALTVSAAVIVPMVTATTAGDVVQMTPAEGGQTVAKPPASPTGEPLDEVFTGGGEVMLWCGVGPGFPVSAMAGGVDGLADEGEVEAALRALARVAGIDAPRALRGVAVAEASWVLLGKGTHGSTEELLVGVGNWDTDGPGKGGEYVLLERANDGYEAAAWGTCNLEPVLPPGLAWAEIAARADALDPEATAVAVMVSERECTSGRSPAPFLNEPVVIERDDSVTVYWTSDSAKGDQTCQGNPSVRRLLQLEEPLGQRELLDGSTWPPLPASG